MQTLPTPRTATEALRLAKTIEASRAGDFTIWPNGDGTCTLDSWKTEATGKRLRDRYAVDLNAWTCTCGDFQGRGQYCKHLFRVREVALEQAQEDFL